MPKPSIYVVKFGGSLLSSKSLHSWMALLPTWAQDKSVVLVPGGGEFADVVRTAQSIEGFDDKHAHALALDAMDRCASVLTAIASASLKRCSLKQLAAVDNASDIRLWVPSVEEFRLSGMAEDWSVTSDSIALWLTSYLEAGNLVLLKMIPPPTPDPFSWSQHEYVDDYFSTLLATVNCDVKAVCDYRDLRNL